MQFSKETMLVRPDIQTLNRYAQKAKQVAITAINPVFEGMASAEDRRRELQALRIQVEGPQQSLNYFQRLVKGSKLDVDNA